MTTADQHQCVYRDALAALQVEFAELRARQKEQEAQFAKLRHEHDVLLRQHFGKHSEKMPAPKDELRKRGDVAKQTPEERKQAREQGRAWTDELQTEEVCEPLPPSPAACEQCQTVPNHPIPDLVSRSFELRPARLVCIKHRQLRARCKCGSTFVTAPAPARLYDRCQYGPGLAAHLIVSKCSDAIAIERVAKQLARLGVPVAASTLASLFHKCAELLTPLYERLCKVVAEQQVVQADETHIKVEGVAKAASQLCEHRGPPRGPLDILWISHPQRAAPRRRQAVIQQPQCWTMARQICLLSRSPLEPAAGRACRVWTFNAGELVVYRYAADRSGETPVQVLGGSQGTLVVDGYTGYNKVTTPGGRTRAGCLAHFRRKLFDALGQAPELQQGLDLILDVYKVGTRRWPWASRARPSTASCATPRAERR